MENPEEILHSLEEFSKIKPKDIPRELEEYLCFVAKTGDPIYQWSSIKSLFREKMISVITEFYETCPSVEIPPCPNVDLFNYDNMKSFILEKLDTFGAAPFTLQRISELLTTPRKEYNRIDKYMRALEKNILVVSTTEPGGRRSAENGDSVMNGLESEHLPETSNSSNDINVEEMDETPAWPRIVPNEPEAAAKTEQLAPQTPPIAPKAEEACSSSQDSVIRRSEEPYLQIEVLSAESAPLAAAEPAIQADDVGAIPAGVQKRRSSVEPVVSTDTAEPTPEPEVVVEGSSTEEISQKIAPKEDEEPVPMKEIKDADSSSNPDEETASESVPESPDTSSTIPEIVSNPEISSLVEETRLLEEISTSEVLLPDEEEKNEVEIDSIVELVVKPDEEELAPIVDTSKSPEVVEEAKDDAEISSSEKIGDEVEALEIVPASVQSAEAEAKQEEKVDEKAVENIEASSVDDDTPMEVDEVSNSEIVKAEATSDSPL